MDLPVVSPFISSEPDELAKEAGLRYISEKIPGIKRAKRGEKFIYVEPNGVLITDEKVLERITRLGIPPAWNDVWISPTRNGHIQATGIDEKGRKQYRYHPDWIALSQEKKFEKNALF